MPTSQATLILHEVENSKPISSRTREFQHRRFQNRIYRFLSQIFKEQQKKGLTKKELAERIDSRPEQINRWLSVPSNLTINTICDLLVGMGMDLDDPSATSLEDLAHETEQPALAAVASVDVQRPLVVGLINIFTQPTYVSPEQIQPPGQLTAFQANTLAQPTSSTYRSFAELEPSHDLGEMLTLVGAISNKQGASSTWPIQNQQ